MTVITSGKTATMIRRMIEIFRFLFYMLFMQSILQIYKLAIF